jgi:type II secretory ATPase GspE/PulE/Tfp pilus assembly ATPase PilB-like protein
LGVSDFHIEAQDLTRYQYTARMHGGKSSKVVVLERNVRDVIVENLVHNLKLAMNKDTLEDPPISSGLIKAMLTNIRGKVIERTFRINIMRASKPPKRVYSIVVRRLKNLEEIKTLGLKGLGYTDKGIELINKIIEKNYGINVVAGATNSGKTTLLTTILEEMREKNNRILSIENPIEIITNYPQFDLSQYENADEKHKLTQKKAMRGFLRHDPDQVLFSEIRDDEIPAFVDLGLRGHTAFATLHAGKVTDVILRLLKASDNVMNVVNALTGIIVQELFPKKCPYCDGKGCRKCNNTGQNGVIPVYEIAFFKNINVSRIVNHKGEIDFSQYFNFDELVKRGEMEYLKKSEIAEELYKNGFLFENDYKKIVKFS